MTSKKNPIYIRTERIVGLVIGIVAIAVAFKTGLFFEVADTILKRFGNGINNMLTQSAAKQRLGMSKYLLAFWGTKSNLINYILGYGPGGVRNIALTTVIVHKDFAVADNEYVTLLIEYGLAGIVFVLGAFKLTFKYIFTDRGLEYKIIAITVLSVAITAFFYEILGAKIMAVILFSLLGGLIQKNN
jgi:hypothetical protein